MSVNRTQTNVDLSQYAPDSGVKELVSIYQLAGEHCQYLNDAMWDILNQTSVQTATWGLERWEHIYQIQTDLSLTIEQRREVLLAKMRGQGTSTVAMIKSVAESFSGGIVEIQERNKESLFVVKFVGTIGIPRNMNGFRNMLEDLKPAHLQYQFEYRFHTNAELQQLKHSQLHHYTHQQLRNEVLNNVRHD